jgi:glycosyltransferase involved in cell wall biosynthesis
MKVMIVTPYFYPKVGGLENYALNVAKGLQDQGHDVLVVTSNHESKARVEERVQGLRVIRLSLLVKLSNTPINLLWRRQLKKTIRIEKPDIINAHTPVPFIADMTERARGHVPFVITYHNDLVKASFVGGFLAKTYNFLFTKRTLKRADGIIATSAYYAHSSPYLQPWQKKVDIVPPGVDMTRFNTSVDKQWLRKKYPNKKIVLFTASLQRTHTHKGLDVLIKAIAEIKKEIPNVLLLAGGDGDNIEHYRNLAQQEGVSDNVLLCGYIPDASQARYYAGSDVFVLPSTTNAEGFGMVLAEAEACGTPVVATKVGGIPSLVEDGQTGILVKPNDVLELAGSIKKVILHNEGSRHYGKEGALKIEKEYSWPLQTEKTSLLLERIHERHEKSIKVCMVHNIVSPYRLPVFEEVNKQVDLTVLFCKPITKDRAWTYDLSQYSFSHIILKGRAIGPVIFNIDALMALIKTKFDVVMINSDPDTAPTVILACVLAKLRHKKILVYNLVVDEKVHFFPALAYSDGLVQRSICLVLSKCVMFYRKICFRAANHFMAFSESAQLFLEEHGVDSSSISRTYQIMPPQLVPESTSKLKRDGKTFLYIGYLNERKGLSYLIDAFMQISNADARLIIAGTGPMEAQLKNRAKGDKRTHFVGYVEEVAKANLYSECDVYVLPTLLDVWGLVINEAIYYGLAVICSDAAEAKDIIDEERGLIVPPANVKKLKKAMLYMLEHPTKMKSMQKHNLHDSSVIDTSRAANGYLDAIRGAML